MRDYQKEFENRVSFIRSVLAESGTDGIVYGNSGGKDSALVSILCKAACDNTIGIMMTLPSASSMGCLVSGSSFCSSIFFLKGVGAMILMPF